MRAVVKQSFTEICTDHGLHANAVEAEAAVAAPGDDDDSAGTSGRGGSDAATLTSLMSATALQRSGPNAGADGDESVSTAEKDDDDDDDNDDEGDDVDGSLSRVQARTIALQGAAALRTLLHAFLRPLVTHVTAVGSAATAALTAARNAGPPTHEEGREGVAVEVETATVSSRAAASPANAVQDALSARGALDTVADAVTVLRDAVIDAAAAVNDADDVDVVVDSARVLAAATAGVAAAARTAAESARLLGCEVGGVGATAAGAVPLDAATPLVPRGTATAPSAYAELEAGAASVAAALTRLQLSATSARRQRRH